MEERERGLLCTGSKGLVLDNRMERGHAGGGVLGTDATETVDLEDNASRCTLAWVAEGAR